MHRLTSGLFVALILCVTQAPLLSENSQYKFGVVHRDCAPWDGAAIAVKLSTKLLQCNRTVEPYLRIAVYDLPIQTDKIIKLDYDNHMHGQAVRCLKGDTCESADSGEVVITSFKEGTGATGRYQMKFRDGSTLSGTFDAKWCELRFFCG